MPVSRAHRQENAHVPGGEGDRIDEAFAARLDVRIVLDATAIEVAASRFMKPPRDHENTRVPANAHVSPSVRTEPPKSTEP
jgi:hypothetical protein